MLFQLYIFVPMFVCLFACLFVCWFVCLLFSHWLAGGEQVDEWVEEGDEAEGVLVVSQPKLVKRNCQGYKWVHNSKCIRGILRFIYNWGGGVLKDKDYQKGIFTPPQFSDSYQIHAWAWWSALTCEWGGNTHVGLQTCGCVPAIVQLCICATVCICNCKSHFRVHLHFTLTTTHLLLQCVENKKTTMTLLENQQMNQYVKNQLRWESTRWNKENQFIFAPTSPVSALIQSLSRTTFEIFKRDKVKFWF